MYEENELQEGGRHQANGKIGTEGRRGHDEPGDRPASLWPCEGCQGCCGSSGNHHQGVQQGNWGGRRLSARGGEEEKILFFPRVATSIWMSW